jgi:hypothetical protein
MEISNGPYRRPERGIDRPPVKSGKRSVGWAAQVSSGAGSPRAWAVMASVR